MPRLLSPRSLALGAVAASLLVYVCATALVPSPVRWFFLKIVRCIGGRERERNSFFLRRPSIFPDLDLSTSTPSLLLPRFKQTQATSRLALRVAGLDPTASGRRTGTRSNLPDYLSSFERRSSGSGSSGSGSSSGRSGEENKNNAFEAAAEVAAADALLRLPLPPPQQQPRSSAPRVHVIVTSNGSPYLNYQTRLLFASWQRLKSNSSSSSSSSVSSSSASLSSNSPTTATKMAGFTRILHRTTDDALTREVPTLRVAPRTPRCDEWCPFPVADRPEAVRSFFAAVRSRGSGGKGSAMIPGMEEERDAESLFYFLAETDYLFLRPLQVPKNLFSSFPPPSSSAASPSSPPQLFDGVAFPFGYIQPRAGVVAPILERLFSLSGGGGEGGSKEKRSKDGGRNLDGSDDSSSSLAVPNTGPSPVLLPLHSWLRLLPAWVSFTETIEQDLEAREVLAWIREMVRSFFLFLSLFFLSFSLLRSHSPRKLFSHSSLPLQKQQYAFSAAAAVSGVKLDLVPPPPPVPVPGSGPGSVPSSSEGKKRSADSGGERGDPLILQPPEDERLGSAAAIHYTWGTRIVRIEGEEGQVEEEEGSERVGGGARAATATAAATEPGEQQLPAEASSTSKDQERLVWEFDKRKTTEASAVELLPRPGALPESFDPRWRLAGSKARGESWKRGKKVSRALYETLKVQVREINACIDWIQEREGKEKGKGG